MMQLRGSLEKPGLEGKEMIRGPAIGECPTHLIEVAV